jgi:hypothetical protein
VAAYATSQVTLSRCQPPTISSNATSKRIQNEDGWRSHRMHRQSPIKLSVQLHFC